MRDINQMRRKERVEQVYQQGKNLNFENQEYSRQVGEFISTALREDVGTGDITTQTVIPMGLEMSAVIKSKESGVFCGQQELNFLYKSQNVSLKFLIADGQEIIKNQRLVEITGSAQTLLTLERVGLNIVRRMSGIATATRSYAQLLQGSGAQVAATRKVVTCELMEKRAVYVGGGLTHRIGLDKHIMIKDCHLDIIKKFQGKEAIESVITACEEVKVPVEIEVETLEDGLLAAQIFARSRYEGVPIIMLDNILPSNISTFCDMLEERSLRDKVLLEASGGITLNNLVDYGASGVDVVSTSAITEGACSLDLHQKMEG